MRNNTVEAQVLIRWYLQHRKIPRSMHDAAIVMVKSRLQAGTLPYLTDWMRATIDQWAESAHMDPPVVGEHSSRLTAPAAAADVRSLSDAELIARFNFVTALQRALVVPVKEAGVHAAIACAAARNQVEMADITDDLVRRVSQRGPRALR